MAKKSDDKTLELIREVNRQKAEISDAERSNWRTNMAWSYIEGSNASTNLNVVSSIEDLIKILAFLKTTQAAYLQAAQELGVQSAPAFKWNRFTYNDWLEDIKLKISKIEVVAKKKKLEALETRLNAIVSPELRAQLEIEAIQKELG